tara:strand:+ start:21003 stop:21872 length:870 start_codon:yes stop_codon:yes gene_type:complete
MKRVLVTGSYGKLGKEVFKPNTNMPFKCIFLSRKKAAIDSPSPNSHIIADLSRKEDIDNNLWGANEVLHMAGATHERDPNKYYRINYEATKTLVDKAETAGVKRFIYLSSQAIGEMGGAYSHSKALAENYIRNSKLKWTIIRPSEVYGPHSNNYVQSLCRFLKHSKVIPIIGDGKYKINPIHINDFVDFILCLLSCNSDKSYYKTYLLAGPSPISFKAFCLQCSNAYGKKPLIVHLPVFLCKSFFSLGSRLRLTKFAPDQIDRLILKKDNDIRTATKDYLFKPRAFSFL